MQFYLVYLHYYSQQNHNTMNNKTHYRKVMKSDHLGIADLEDLIEEGKKLIFTVKEVKQEYGVSVAGKRGDFNIAYFVEKIKPLVLNSTNAKQLKSFSNNSPFVEDWKNVLVELYIDENVKMKGEIVGGVRIKPIQPKLQPIEKKQFTEANFAKAKEAKATIEQIEKAYSISEEVKVKYLAYAGL
jgi:hypothetical protein